MTTTPDALHRIEQTHLFARRSYDAEALVRDHPPRLLHANKKHLFQLACPPDKPPRGTIVFSRYREISLPAAFPAPGNPPLEHIMREDVFGYEPPAPGTVEWYLNFADEHLFFGYGGPLFAQ